MKKLLVGSMILTLLAGVGTVCMARNFDEELGNRNPLTITVLKPADRVEVCYFGRALPEDSDYDISRIQREFAYDGTVEPSFGENGLVNTVSIDNVNPDDWYGIKLFYIEGGCCGTRGCFGTSVESLEFRKGSELRNSPFTTERSALEMEPSCGFCAIV